MSEPEVEIDPSRGSDASTVSARVAEDQLDAEDLASAQSTTVLLDHARLSWQAEEENARKLDVKEALLLSIIAVLFGAGFYGIAWHREDTPSIDWPAGVWLVKALVTLGLLVFARAFFGILDVLSPVLVQFAWMSTCQSFWSFIAWVTANDFDRLEWRQTKRVYTPIRLHMLSRLFRQRCAVQRNHLRDMVPRRPNVLRASHHLRLDNDDYLHPERLTESQAIDKAYANTVAAYLELLRRNSQRRDRLRGLRAWFHAGAIINGFAVILWLWLAEI